jgi:hypothetical protein
LMWEPTAHGCKQASTSTPVLTPQTQAKMLAYDRVVSELNAARLRGTSYPIVHSLIQAALATPNDVSLLFFAIVFPCQLYTLLSWVFVFFVDIRTLFDLLTLLSLFSRLFSLIISFTAAFRSFVTMISIHSLTKFLHTAPFPPNGHQLLRPRRHHRRAPDAPATRACLCTRPQHPGVRAEVCQSLSGWWRWWCIFVGWCSGWCFNRSRIGSIGIRNGKIDVRRQ